MSAADFGDFEDGQSPLWERLPTTSGSRCVLPQHCTGTSHRLASVWGCRAGPSRVRARRHVPVVPCPQATSRTDGLALSALVQASQRTDDREVDIHLPVAAEQ